MSYICTKRLRLGGSTFLPGDTVPAELFVDGRASKLISYGMLAESTENVPTASSNTEAADAALSISIEATEDSEASIIAVNAEQLQTAVNIMRGTATTAAEAIAEEVDEATLLFVFNVDSRKDVKKAAQKQLSVIASLKGDGTNNEE